jgi:hypothetical protein
MPRLLGETRILPRFAGCAKGGHGLRLTMPSTAGPTTIEVTVRDALPRSAGTEATGSTNRSNPAFAGIAEGSTEWGVDGAGCTEGRSPALPS